MFRTLLVAGILSVLSLVSACQSGSSGAGSPPSPAEPSEEPMAQPPAEEPASDPAPEPMPAAGSGDVPSVVLEDGRDLMSLDALPPRTGTLPHAEVPAGDPTTADAVYTLEQAARGAELVKGTCSECHDPEDWRERGFLGRWAGESTYQLWYYINDRMPYRNPWTLTRQQVTDALSYILYVNELPPGDEEMGIDDDSIDDYWIVWDSATH